MYDIETLNKIENTQEFSKNLTCVNNNNNINNMNNINNSHVNNNR